MLRKADSDLANARLCLKSGESLDTACFHCQQAAERALKAFLTAHEVMYPHTHNLQKLIEQCTTIDASFGDLETAVSDLTPFAVELRYDEEFWPDTSVVKLALDTAEKIRELVGERMNRKQ